MVDAKARAAASVAQAQAELDRAIAEIDSIQVFDPSFIALVAHALSNYITVTGATVEMLQWRLHDDADPDVATWLGGIRHATDLMQHSVGRLVSLTAPDDFPLKLDYVNLPLLMQRACHFYRTRAETGRTHIACAVVGHVPLVWADRVAVAVMADNLLSRAVRVSAHGTVRVQVRADGSHVLCTVRDTGPGYSPEEQERLFQPPDLRDLSEPPRPGSFGLLIARDFARRLGGDLWCDSEPGRGATFSFRLPAVE